MKPRFSVIVPLYNKAPYVRKALESVCAQTCTVWECIVVDDGSTDESAAICDEFIQSLPSSLAPSFHIIHQPNAGVAAARNRGVAASQGEYVCFLDADDWWQPEFLEEIDRLIAAYPNAGIYATNYVYFKPGKTHIALHEPDGLMNYPRAYLANGSMPVTSITACMPRKVFNEMGGFPEWIVLGEDFLLWAKTALHHPIAYSSKPLAIYNNAVPPSQRATCNLYTPEKHMLFHLDEIEQLAAASPQAEEWKALLDKLKEGRKQFNQPMWWRRFKQMYMRLGSLCKKVILQIGKS